MPRRWIVNASPIVTLSKAGHIGLLRATAESMSIPEAVAREIAAASPNDPARIWIETDGAACICPATVDPRVAEWNLGAGETAVLSLALERPGTDAVVDDAAARKAAATLGIPAIGTLGVVVLARGLGLILAASPVVDDLRRSGLYLSENVLRSALRLAGEE